MILMIFLSLALLALAAEGGGRGTRVAMDPKTEKDIYTVNGRTELWQDVVLQIQDNWCIGIGFYGSRYVLMNIWPWAGHTHNSFLEVALGTGVVGLVICTLFVGHVARAIWRTRDGLLLGTATYCMIIGNTNPIIFYPCLQMFVLMVVLIGSSSQKPQRKTKERDKGNVHDRARVVRAYLAKHPEIVTEPFPSYAPEASPREMRHMWRREYISRKSLRKL